VSDKSDPDVDRGYRARLWLLKHTENKNIRSYFGGLFSRIGLLLIGGWILGDILNPIAWPAGAVLIIVVGLFWLLPPQTAEVERRQLQKQLDERAHRRGHTVLTGPEAEAVAQILHGPSYGDAWLHAMTTLEKKFPEESGK
jgi:hypothetical protein